MKKLALALLLAVSTQAFAQKHEMIFSPGYTSYHGHSTKSIPKNLLGDLDGSGYQLSLYYLHNLKWVQFGGGFEFGQLSADHAESILYTTTGNTTIATIDRMEHYAIADPYIAGNAQVNFTLPVKRWKFYAGGTIGYISTHANSRRFAVNPELEVKEKYRLGGIYRGVQAGAICRLSHHLAISADVTARFAHLANDKPSWFNDPFIVYDRLNLYNFGLGMRYRF